MRGVNKCILIGNLGRDPEVRRTQKGTAVVTLNVATTEKWKKDGVPQEETTWHRVVAWDKLAEICEKYLLKGRQVYIEGKIKTREWEDKQGNKQKTTEIVADQLVMLGSKDQQASLEEQIFKGPEDEVP